MSCCRAWPTAHVLVFALALAGWTVALLSPVPNDSARKVFGSQWGVFLFAKTVHVGTYAALTVLGGTAAALGRRWWWVLPGLVAHGGLTEYLQGFVGRGSRIEDVGLDSLGIAIGGLVVLAYRAVTRPRPPAGPPSPE
jgi:VanZ family protein